MIGKGLVFSLCDYLKKKLLMMNNDLIIVVPFRKFVFCLMTMSSFLCVVEICESFKNWEAGVAYTH
jgi:hypothetical protein